MRAACEHEHGTDTSPLGVPKPSRTDLLRSITPWGQTCPAPWTHDELALSGYCVPSPDPNRTTPDHTGD